MADNNVVEIAVQVRDATRAGVQSIQNGMGGIQKGVKSVTDAIFSMWGALAGGAAIGAFAVISEDLRKAEQAAVDAAQGSVEALEKVKAVSKEVWLDGFGGNATEAAKLAATAFRELGDISEDELGRAATAGAQLESRFGADYQKTLQSIGLLMRDFGLTSKEATDFVTAGFQKNLDSSGDFLDSILEYSPQFKTAGAGAGEFFSALETGAGRGIIGTDAVADSFKELNDKIKSGSTDVVNNLQAIGLNYDKLAGGINSGKISITDAFNIIQKAIKETENSTTQFQAGAALLGEPFIKMGQEAFLAIDTTKTSIESLSGSTENLNQGYVGLAASFTKLSREIIDAFSGEILNSSKQVEDQINGIIQVVQDLKSSGALAEWAAGAGEAFNTVLNWIKQAIEAYPKLAKEIQTTFADIEIYYNSFIKKINEVRAKVAGLSGNNAQVEYFNKAADAAQFEIDKLENLKKSLKEIPLLEAQLATPLQDLSPAYAQFLDNIEGLENGTLKWGDATQSTGQKITDIASKAGDDLQALYTQIAEKEKDGLISTQEAITAKAEASKAFYDKEYAAALDNLAKLKSTYGEDSTQYKAAQLEKEAALEGLKAATAEFTASTSGSLAEGALKFEEAYTASLENVGNQEAMLAEQLATEKALALSTEEAESKMGGLVAELDGVIAKVEGPYSMEIDEDPTQAAFKRLAQGALESATAAKQAIITLQEDVKGLTGQMAVIARQNLADLQRKFKDSTTEYEKYRSQIEKPVKTKVDTKEALGEQEKYYNETIKNAEINKARLELINAQGKITAEQVAAGKAINDKKINEERLRAEIETADRLKNSYRQDSLEYLKAATDKINKTKELQELLTKSVTSVIDFKGKASPELPLTETLNNVQSKFKELQTQIATGAQATVGIRTEAPGAAQIQAAQTGINAQDMGKINITIGGKGGELFGAPDVIRIVKEAFANEQRLGYA